MKTIISITCSVALICAVSSSGLHAQQLPIRKKQVITTEKSSKSEDIRQLERSAKARPVRVISPDMRRRASNELNTLLPARISSGMDMTGVDDDIFYSANSFPKTGVLSFDMMNPDPTFMISWRQMETPFAYMKFREPGDSLAQWFVPLAACSLKSVRIMPGSFQGEMILNIYSSNYDGQIDDPNYTNANGWIGDWDNGQWIPGNNLFMNVSPLGRKIWGPDTISVTDSMNFNWIDIPTSSLGIPNIGSNPFMIAFETHPIPGKKRIAYEWAVTPYHFFQYFNGSRTPSGNTGWHIRNRSIWVEAEVIYYGDIPPILEDPDRIKTTPSTDPIPVSVKIVDYNPSGGNTGVDVAEVRYDFKGEGEFQSVLISDADGDSIFTGNLPGFLPGDEIDYHFWARDVEGNETQTPDYSYSIFNIEDPILVIYNESVRWKGHFTETWMKQFYFLGYGGYEWSNSVEDPYVYGYDLWDNVGWGRVNPDVLENYDVIIQLDNQFPFVYQSDLLMEWISGGKPENPRRLFIASQDYPYVFNPLYPDSVFAPGTFEYDYLGIERLRFELTDPNGSVSMRGVQGDSISGFVWDYSDTTGFLFKYDPASTLGHRQRIDIITPTPEADTTFIVYNEVEGLSGVRNSGPGFQTVFLSFDPLGCLWTNEVDSTVWVIGVENIIGKALQWFNAPVGEAIPPTIILDLEGLDFSSLAVGDTSELQLIITNEGTDPLEILNVESSIPLVTVSDTSGILYQGDALEVNLTFMPDEIADLDETLYVTSDDPENPLIELQMTAEVFASIIEVSTGALDFGLVSVGEVDTMQFDISNIGRSSLIGYTITSTNEAFTVSDSAFNLPADSTITLEVYFTPTEIVLEEGNIVILTNDPETPESSVYCKGIGFDPMQLLPEPRIIAVEDVPRDQGGRVRIIWARSILDEEDSGVNLTHYTVWRRSPGIDDHWDYVDDVAAVRLDLYGYVAQTLGDSTADGIFWSEFMVASHTDDSQVFYFSAAVAGYSTDDLSPRVPQNVKATPIEEAILLTWEASPDPDMEYYAIYRSLEPSFVPDTVYAASTDTLFEDLNVEIGTEYYYKISSFDFSGNESIHSTEVSATYTGVDLENIPNSYELYQNYPNPFNPATTISYSLPAPGEVLLTIYNLRGEEIARLVDDVQSVGRHEVKWNAGNVASGLYLYRLQTVDFVQTRKMVLLR